jgi:hypothetical protein
MHYSELTAHQKHILRLVAEEDDFKGDSSQLTDCNYLCSQKILEYCGSARYGITELGRKLLQLDPILYKNKEEILS